LKKFFSDTISNFAKFIALSRAIKSTIPTIHSASFSCNEAEWMVGIVLARARHTAKIRTEKGYFTRYPVLKDASSDERLSVQCDIFQYHYMDIAGTSRERNSLCIHFSVFDEYREDYHLCYQSSC
jgi:hypothetical protein